MKKITSIVLVAILALSLVACGGKKADTESVQKTTLSSEAVTIDGNYGKATKVSTEPLKIDSYSKLADYVKDKTTGSVVYDITLKDNDGKAVQPEGKVKVTVNTESISDKNSDYVVYHVADDGKFEKMEKTASSDKSVTFETTHFSVYVVLAYDKTVRKDDDFAKNSDAATAEVASETKKEEEAAHATGYTYTDMEPVIMYTTKAVSVRDLPDTSGKKLTTVSGGTNLIVFGKCNETGWYRVEYANDKVGYVSNSYMSTEKPKEKQEAAASNSSSQQQKTNSGVPHNMNEAKAYCQNVLGWNVNNVEWIDADHFYSIEIWANPGNLYTTNPDPGVVREWLPERVNSYFNDDHTAEGHVMINRYYCTVTGRR
ncbi:MAG: SH3 domain-containing protein [Lachnospiraceae bacterium]|nr:SH3 domain-containing protein [Lachnospiraceae bacterium]